VIVGAPKGNKYAVGNILSGRPAQYDSIALAKSLEDWSKKPNSFKLAGFCVEQDICHYVIYDLDDRCEVFSRSLRMARLRISERRDALASENKMPIKMWERYVDSFDPFLQKHEKEKKEHEESIKNDKSNHTSKIIMEVKYGPGVADQVELHPETISTESPPCTTKGD
jgi:hypothetical protein